MEANDKQQEAKVMKSAPEVLAAPLKKLLASSLEHFCSTMTRDDQIALISSVGVDAMAFSEAARAHKDAAMADINSAIDAIKSSRKKSSSSKADQLRLRYYAELKTLAEAGITAKEMVGYLKERHKFVVTEPAVKQLLNVVMKDTLMKAADQLKELEKYPEWTTQQMALHLKSKFATKVTAAVVRAVRQELAEK